MNGVIYCRVSSKEQIEGTSLESQESACREYARQHNLAILKVFVERGESAKFADRTQLLDLIDFCKSSKCGVQVLLVWKIDRFARNVGDHFNVKALLAKYGVRIVSVTEPIDTNPEGRLMETILAGFAQFDNDIRAVRTVQGMKKRLQEGVSPWKPPLGYKTATVRGEKKTQPDLPTQPLFGLLQKAWKEYATGGYTKAEILRLMTNWGIATPRGKPLSPQSLDYFFRNSYYAGILKNPWTGEEYEGKHVPMVSRADFARVQRIVGRNNRAVPHRASRPEFPLRGLVRCPGCRAYMTGSFSRGRSRRYPYYRCYSNCRTAISFPAAPIHQEFGEFLDRQRARPELIERLGDAILQAAEGRRAAAKDKQARLEREVAELTRQIQELVAMRAAGLIDDQEFATQKRALADRRASFDIRRNLDPFNPKAVRRDIDRIKGPLSEPRETWRRLTPPLQGRFQRAILPGGFVNGRIGTAEKALIFSTFDELNTYKTNLVPLADETWNRLIAEIKGFSAIFHPENEDELAA
ncbi:MAG: recombinase family protein [Bryobacteraceae bacterium]